MTQISDVAMIRHAQKFFAERRYDDATVFCQELLKRKPNHYEALLLLMDLAWNRREREQAFKYGRQVTKAFPLDGPAHAKLAFLYDSTGRHQDAIRLLQRFRKKSPDDLAAINGLAHSHQYMGDLEKALALLEPLVQSAIASAEMAHNYASIKFEQKQYDKVIEVENRHLKNPAVTPGILEAMYLLLGRAHEATGDIDNAFAAYTAANKVFPPEGKYGKAVEEHDSIIHVFSHTRMKSLPRARNGSRLPVFIISRPRSGGTLVERIISAHPSVHAAGEFEILRQFADRLNLTIGSALPFPECVLDVDQNDADQLAGSFLEELQALAPRAQRITNKHLGTWKYLGLLAIVCPKAILIDLRRDPVDNGLGIFTAQLKGTMSFGRDLHEIGLFHREYERMMDHWHSVLDIPILKVNYEDIVADQEHWSRKIIEHCGLEWDDRVLQFHEKDAQKSSSAAPTLSYQQVRQPIYKTSVSRAKRFEKHLEPLYEALGLPYPPKAADSSG